MASSFISGRSASFKKLAEPVRAVSIKVEFTYMAVISYFDKIVQPSYSLTPGLA